MKRRRSGFSEFMAQDEPVTLTPYRCAMEMCVEGSDGREMIHFALGERQRR